MFKAAGFTDADLARPVIGIANTWIEIGPCNYHLRELAGHVREGIRAAGATAMEFNTVSISDGITMGTPGMRMSLVSREVIADSIELVAAGNRLDGVIALVGCDKTIPGAAMALARLNLPGLVLYGGSIAPGHVNGRDVTIQDVFEGGRGARRRPAEHRRTPRSRESRLPRRRRLRRPVHRQHDGGCLRVPRTVADGERERAGGGPCQARRSRWRRARSSWISCDERSRRATSSRRAAFENAITSVAATGGSTNAVLHLLAIAREAGVDLDLETFNEINARVPWIADLKPAGRYVATDLHRAGGTALVARRLADAGLLNARRDHRQRPIDRRRSAAATETAGQDVVRPIAAPLSATGGLVILKGTLAPDGCVLKVAGHPRTTIRGTARVFDGEEAAFAAVQAGAIRAGRRRRDPVRGPARRSRDARDARGHGRYRRRRPRRSGRARHRRPLLGRHAWADGRARRAGSRGWGPHRRRP